MISRKQFEEMYPIQREDYAYPEEFDKTVECKTGMEMFEGHKKRYYE